MRRDMDLVRDLLLKVEEAPKPPSWKEVVPEGDEAASQAALDHLKLLEDEGFIESNLLHMRGYRMPENIKLTWKGHDFLDSIRDPKIWEKTKAGALGAGGFTVDLLKDLAKGLIKKQIEDHTGVQL